MQGSRGASGALERGATRSWFGPVAAMRPGPLAAAVASWNSATRVDGENTDALKSGGSWAALTIP